jgi:hypothetical protein
VLAVFVWTSGAGGPAVAWPALTREDVLPMLLSLGAIVAATLATWRASVWLGRGART